MKKRFLSFLMAACMVFALLPVTARAAATITDIAVTITEPQVGQALPTDAAVASPDGLKVVSVKWYSGPGGELPKGTRIEQGKQYILSITVEIASGTDAEFGMLNQVKPTVNGKEAIIYIPPTQTAKFSMEYFFAEPVKEPDPIVPPSVENYDTFDYRAYANMYPDVKAAYGYNAEKLYAHYVNYGKAEGRVGTFISGSNPKTNAPITADNADGRLATLLNPYPPTLITQQPYWAENQYTPFTEMSNNRLVAEYWFTQAYLKEGFEAFKAHPGVISNDGKHTWVNDTVQIAVNALRDELYARVGAFEKGYGEAYESAMASDPTILSQFRDLQAGNFPVPPADPGVAGQKPAPTTPTAGGFSDVLESDYFADPVVWAVDNKITSGTSTTTFSPSQTCTQAQILTFLWRAAKSPEPKGNVEMDGLDGSEYYYKAAMWAAEQNMVGGGFNPDEPCTRSMAVTFMWKYAKSPSAPAASFTDVPAGADYAQAVAWAVENDVTKGTSSSEFSPAQTCTRGQIVTFLYRAFSK